MRRFVVLALAGATLLAGCQAGLPLGVVYPSIEPVAGAPISVSHDFVFEGQPTSLVVNVDSGVYQGATAAEKTVTRFGNARENDWIVDYYPAFVDEDHQEQFFADVLAATRAVRGTRALDSDRYAELLAVFVQSLRYETDPADLSPKFPIETFVEGAGDCDDKTLLLAGLMAREGYDVAIMLFETEQHVALGIRSADLGYLDTGYAFVETTNASFIGMVPDELAGGVVLTSKPQVFGIGDGQIAYTAGPQVHAILDARDRVVRDAAAMSSRIKEADLALASLETQTSAAASRLESLKSAGRIAEYNAEIPAYNDLAGRYNAAVRERNDLAAQYNRLAELETAIVEGLDDRPATYAAVMSAP